MLGIDYARTGFKHSYRRSLDVKKVAILSLALLLGCLTAPASADEHQASSAWFAYANCSNIQVSIRPYKSSAGAGHVGIMYQIHNLWNRPCGLFGYPGVKLLDAQFSTLPTQLTRGLGYLVGGRSPRLVHLGPHGSAYFLLEWDHIPTDAESCPVARYLMITPPNDYLPVVTYAASGSGITPCGGKIIASPVAGTAFPI